MKLPILTTAFFALVAAFSAQPAKAVYMASSNDLILSFIDPSQPNVFQVDLGNVSNFMGLPTFTARNLNPDLTNIFGANYYNDANLFFSVTGTNTTTKADYVTTSTATPYDPLSFARLSTASNKNLALLYSNYGSAATSGTTPNSDILKLATVNDINTAQANTFGGFSNEDGATVQTTFGQLLPPTLGLDVLVSSGGVNTSTEVVDALGTPYVFSISPAGVLTYTATDAQVPEPSTYALMLVGTLGAFVIARRKSIVSL